MQNSTADHQAPKHARPMPIDTLSSQPIPPPATSLIPTMSAHQNVAVSTTQGGHQTTQFMQILHPTQQQAQGQLPLHVLQQLFHHELNQSIPQPATFMHQVQPDLYQAAHPIHLHGLNLALGAHPGLASGNGSTKRHSSELNLNLNEEDDPNETARAKQARTAGVKDYEFDFEQDEPPRVGGGGGGGGSEALEQNRAKNREAQRRFRERQKSVIGQLRADMANLETEVSSLSTASAP
jgi:hypothetical protein